LGTHIVKGVLYTVVLAPVYIEWVSKEIPLQALTGPEGSRRLRLPDFKTLGI
jgi:hypothetical protein